jgi:hypothetical protein
MRLLEAKTVLSTVHEGWPGKESQGLSSKSPDQGGVESAFAAPTAGWARMGRS